MVKLFKIIKKFASQKIQDESKILFVYFDEYKQHEKMHKCTQIFDQKLQWSSGEREMREWKGERR